MKRHFVFLVLILVFLYGCQQKAVKQPESQPTGQEMGQELQDQKEQEPISEQEVASIESKDISKISPKYKAETEGMFEDILFDYDKYNINDEYKPVLQSISSWMMKNSSAKLLIEGHCDERGTNEYNLALGDRRAKATKDFLRSIGVSSARMDIISYGEEKPLCSDQNEGCWSKNRRAHFVILNKGK
jgi:peptidoglycan-associated lipoprotein